MPRQPRQRARAQYTKVLSALRKTELIRLADDFDIPADGSVVEIRARLKIYLDDNRENLFRNPVYRALYPRRQQRGPQPPPVLPQPMEETPSVRMSISPEPSNHSTASWAGIVDILPQPPVTPPRHHTPAYSMNSVERYSPAPQPEANLELPAALLQAIADEPVFAPVVVPAPQVIPMDVPHQTGNTPLRKRPSRIPGFTANNAAFLIPDHIRKKFVDGWNTHIPLTYLTDKGCIFKSKAPPNSSHDLLTIDESNGRITSTAKPLSDEGELDITFDEWHQAWRRLHDLISTFLPDEAAMWQAHYLFILNNDNRAEMWPLYLAYDIEIRKRATQFPIDPSQFSIGIWNDLETRYMAKKVYTQVQTDLRFQSAHASSSNINHSPSYARFHPFVQNNNDHSQYPARGSFRSQPSRNLSQRFAQSNHAKAGRCIFCGDTTKSHISRNCTAVNLVNGSPCHLLKLGPAGSRQDKAGKLYCFAWNGFSGCDQNPSCQRGEHWCSLCGAKSHNAQQCASAS